MKKRSKTVSAAVDPWMAYAAGGTPRVAVPVSSSLVHICKAAGHGYPVYGGGGCSDGLARNRVCCAARASFPRLGNPYGAPTPPWTVLA